MQNKEYSFHYAEMNDIDSLMNLIEMVRGSFPALETAEQMSDCKQIVITCMNCQTALCMKHNAEIVGILLFSAESAELIFLAVHPGHRRKGIAEVLIEKMLALILEDAEISVCTFRENDIKGKGPRALYKKFGFREAELVTLYDYPFQKLVLRRKQ
ncbi:MAG: GNAT family N-acetyltransferase [Negativicutes bacterium]